MRPDSTARRLAVILLFALALGALSSGLQAQSDFTFEAPGADLPFAWQGENQIDVTAVSQTMPPFEVLAADGDFVISRVDSDGHIRILPAFDALSAAPRRLALAWQPTGDELAQIAGQIVEVSLSARAYSPPDGVRLYVAEGEVPNASQSNETIDDVGWQDYSVARLIADDADTVAIGFDWVLPAGNSWLEFRDMKVAIQTADAYTGTLAPTFIPPTPIPTSTPLVVTSTPVAADVFAAATLVAEATEQARSVGTATPTPENVVTATFTPLPTETPTPFLILATSTPGNQATATTEALRARAIAFTTGTPTALPYDAFVVTATSTPTPKLAPTKTPTPLFVLLENILPTNTPNPTPTFPEELVGKILFKATYRGTEQKPDYMVMNPDGSDVGRLSSGYWYNRAVERERYSANRQYYAFVKKEQDGFHRLQIFYDDVEFGTTHQATLFGAGKAWDPVWSPTDDVLALVSNENANDEIWIVRRGEWPAIQLTDNNWEWDKHPSWSPDGSQIVFASNRDDGRQQIWIMDADGSNPRRLIDLPFDAWDPVWVKYPDS